MEWESVQWPVLQRRAMAATHARRVQRFPPLPAVWPAGSMYRGHTKSSPAYPATEEQAAPMRKDAAVSRASVTRLVPAACVEHQAGGVPQRLVGRTTVTRTVPAACKTPETSR